MANSVFITPFGGTIQGDVIITGQGLFADGTAAAPSVSFANQTDMGLYKRGSNQLGVSAGGSEVAFFGPGAFLASDSALIGFSTDTRLNRDTANTLAQKNAANAQTLRIYGNATGPKYLSLGHNGTDAILDTAASSGIFSIAPTNATSVSIGKKVGSYVGITTDGTLGVSVVTGGPTQRKVGATNAQTIGSFTVGAADATFRVSANILVTTATTHSFTVTCAYTDEGNTARTLTLNFSTLAGVISNTAIGNAGGAVPYNGVVQHIRCKAATTITIATTGTFTTVVYNGEGYIEQLG